MKVYYCSKPDRVSTRGMQRKAESTKIASVDANPRTGLGLHMVFNMRTRDTSP